MHAKKLTIVTKIYILTIQNESLKLNYFKAFRITYSIKRVSITIIEKSENTVYNTCVESKGSKNDKREVKGKKIIKPR